MMNVKAKTLALIAMPCSLIALFWLTYPFADVIATKTFSLSSLNAAQKNNIRVASRALDNIVIKPGEVFSFNRLVGPRTDRRGYRAAPSYLGPESPATVGGGICLLSSALYQAALESGLSVTERVPHLRTIKTVAPGLDSTVWYGSADLKFKNDTATPIQIHTSWESQQLNVKILGRQETNRNHFRLRTVICQRTKDKVLVEVLRQNNSSTKRISLDLYDVTN